MSVPQGRRSSTFTRLLRHGFTDPSAAERLLDVPDLSAVRSDPLLLDALGATADPDLALLGLVRLVEAQAGDPERRELLDTLITAKPLRDRLLGVLGASEALADHLARHPLDWQALVTYEPSDLHPGVEEFERGLADAGDPNSLRVAYRRCLLSIAARDVCGTTDIAQTAAELADLATATLRAALAMAQADAPGDAALCRLAVIAMGKCGGHELNYVSDVDVIFVGEAVEGADEGKAIQAATRLASHMMRICSDTTVEGTIWPVDANLRPEGRNGPLVRTLSSHLAYYQRWAKTWEFQALLKARPVAGDLELGDAYVRTLSPLVWQAAERENFVPDVQRMRKRVVENIPAGEVDRELKLGPGGLRDVEFAVQLLQLVHGRADLSLRSGTTLDALAALADGGYVGRVDAVQLDDAYRFLRTLEHRIQLYRLRRTHLVPEGDADLRRTGRSMGMRTEPITELHRAWRRHTSVVRRLHEKLFYRPLLDAVAQLASGETRLSTEAARERLVALGYHDPSAALRHLEALASGVTRKAAIQRTLLPVLLGWFADSADPDAGLLNFRKVSDALGKTPWYLRLLRDEGAAAENLARVLSAGRLAPDLLMRAPEAVALLGDQRGLEPRGHAQLEQEVLAAVGRADGAEQAVAAARGVRRRELFRTSAADIIASYGTEDTPAEADQGALVDRVGGAVSDITAATLAGTLRAVVREGWGTSCPPGSASSPWGGSADTSSATGRTPTCCSCTSRARASTTRRRRRPRTASCPRCGGCSPCRARIRRSSSTRTCGPRASRVRSCAPSSPMRRTTGDGPWCGSRRRSCGPNRSRATWTWGGASSTSSTRCGSRPRGSARTPCARSGGSRRGWSPSGCRAARTRRCTRSWAAAGSPTSSGRSSSSSSSRGGRSRGCARPAPVRRSPRRARRS